jgi:propanol-preferring alcohol dehydrogenase
MGLLVCAIDIDDGKLAHAKRLGADLVFNAKTSDAAAAVKKETGGGAHGVLITAPSLIAFKQGVGMTRKLGTCVLVGLPPGEFPVPLFDVVANCITVRGSFVGTREDMAETLAFAAAGKVKADIELQPLSAINQVFERLAHGDGFRVTRQLISISPATARALPFVCNSPDRGSLREALSRNLLS